MDGARVHGGGYRRDEVVGRERFGRKVVVEAVQEFGIIGIEGLVKEGLEV